MKPSRCHRAYICRWLVACGYPKRGYQVSQLRHESRSLIPPRPANVFPRTRRAILGSNATNRQSLHPTSFCLSIYEDHVGVFHQNQPSAHNDRAMQHKLNLHRLIWNRTPCMEGRVNFVCSPKLQESKGEGGKLYTNAARHELNVGQLTRTHPWDSGDILALSAGFFCSPDKTPQPQHNEPTASKKPFWHCKYDPSLGTTLKMGPANCNQKHTPC